MDKEILNRAVFTTVYVIENNSPIVYVSHDMEDDWQFFGPETNVKLNEGRIVSLGEILERDASIKSILTMPKGTEAHRTEKGGEWIKVNKS